MVERLLIGIVILVFVSMDAARGASSATGPLKKPGRPQERPAVF
jgi:hypothetical protein